MNSHNLKALPPGSVVGILGGGQLGRMLALAAAELGFKCHIYSPPGDNPAFDVAAQHTAASYDDKQALREFAAIVDVVTFEFENIPDDCLSYLKQEKPVRPDVSVLSITQDRIDEKQLARSLGIAVPAFARIDTLQDLQSAIDKIGYPAVLKTRRFGYDGKGQTIVRDEDSLSESFKTIGEQPAILEAFVPFEKEISIIAARDAAGDFTVFDIPENNHENHILRASHVPANVSTDIARQAVEIARKLADGMGYVGVFAVELFLVPENGKKHLMMNEIAPRVHNSGHWTSDACHVSQFEQHIRAITGLPLADPRRHSNAVMHNLLGDEALDISDLAAKPGMCIHLYGKQEARKGRKMGHATQLTPRKPE